MSYEIIFEQCVVCINEEDFIEQMQQFAIQRLGASAVDFHQATNHHELIRLFRQFKLPTPPMQDMYHLHMLVGCNNLIDAESNQIARSWQFCAVGSEDEIISRFGIRWAQAVEDGSIKPNGRWSKAENWIRSLRKKLKEALHYSHFQYSPLSVNIDKGEAGCEKLERLRTVSALIGATIKEESLFGEEQFHLSIRSESMVEMWLFQKMVLEYKEQECWINGIDPPSHIVKGHSI